MGRPRYIKLKRDRLTGNFEPVSSGYIRRKWRSRDGALKEIETMCASFDKVRHGGEVMVFSPVGSEIW